MLGHAELKFESRLCFQRTLLLRGACANFLSGRFIFCHRALSAMNPKLQKDISSAIATEFSHINKFHTCMSVADYN